MGVLFWVYMGIALVVIEMMTPGVTAIFFGIAAFIVALLTWALRILPAWLQWLMFSVFSVLSLVLLRKTFKKIFVGDRDASEGVADEFAGKHATVAETILPNRSGRVEFLGCTWTAESDEEIPAGTRVRIRSKENITLFVERD